MNHGRTSSRLGTSTSQRARRTALLAASVGVSLLAQHATLGSTYTWDPSAKVTGTAVGGAGTWTSSSTFSNGSADVTWPNTSPNADQALFANVGGTVTVTTAINVNSIRFNATTTAYTLAGGTGGSLTFSGTNPELDANGSLAGTITMPVGGFGPGSTLTVNLASGNTGTVNLNAANSFSGVTFNVNAGKLSLGSSTNQITGSANFVRNGGNTSIMTLTQGNNNTGNWTINGGVVEGQAGSSFGTGTVTINGNTTAYGEMAVSGQQVTNNVVLNGGILGGDNGTATYAGQITVSADSRIRLGDFYSNTGSRNLLISGNLVNGASTTGNLSLVSGGTSFGGALNGQVLMLSGNNSGYTGTLTIDGGHAVEFKNASAFTGGTLAVTNTAGSGTGMPIVALGFVGAVPTFTGSADGVFALGSGVNWNTDLDMSGVGAANGNWFLGADVNGGGTFSANLSPSSGVYRIGGGQGTLTIASSALSGLATTIIGDTRTGGGGTVVLTAAQTSTGATSLNAGTLRLDTGGSLASDITVGTGANLVFNHADAYSFANAIHNNANVTQSGTGNLTLAGTIDGTGTLTQTGAGGLVLAGTMNSGTLAQSGTGALLVNGTLAGSTAVVQNGPGGFTLAGANTYSGTTTVNNTLTIASTGSVTSTGTLTLNGAALNASASAVGSSFGATTVNAGSSQIVGGAGSLTLNAITRVPGGVIDFTPGSGGITTSTPNASFAGGSQTILGGYATVGGSTWAVSGSGATAGAITGLTSYVNTFSSGSAADVDSPSDAPAGAMTVNSLRFDAPAAYNVALGGNLTVATGGVLETANVGANDITLSGNSLLTGNGQDLIVIQNNTAGKMNISSTIGAAGQAFTKAGPGTAVLSSANPFDKGLFVVGGSLQYTDDNQLGAAGKAVTLNGGTLSFAGTTTNGYFYGTATGGKTSRPITIGPAGGTFNIVNAGKSLGGYVGFSVTGQISGSGMITKTGPGWIGLQNGQSNTGMWNITAGVVELGSATGLGTNSTVTVAGDGGTNWATAGELAWNASGGMSYGINLAGGMISGDNNPRTYSGQISVSANSSLRLGDFYGSTARDMSITGSISSAPGALASNLTLRPPLGNTNSGQVLTLTGNNTGYTGTLQVPLFFKVRFTQTSNPTAAANSVIKNINFSAPSNDVTKSLPVVLFDSTDTGNSFLNVALPNITVADPAANTGIFAYNGGAYVGPSNTLDLSRLADGKVFFGTVGGGSIWSSKLIPGSDYIVRLTGGGASVSVGNVNLLSDYTDTSNVVHPVSLQVGAVAANGGGTVQFLAPQNYSGGTAIANGTLKLGSNASPATTGSLPGPTLVTFGTATTNGTLDLNGFNTTVGGLAVAAAVPTANTASQVVTNNAAVASTDSVLTVDTTPAASSFAGLIKDGANHKIGLTVKGSNSLTLTGANTYTGATTVKAGSLVLGSSAWAPVTTNAGGADVQGGKLVFDYTGASTPQGTVVPLLAASYANNGFNNTNQIRSTTADSAHGLGWADDGASKLTVAYTWYGDINLDGTVNADDYALMDRAVAKGLGAASPIWVNGDFNYDGSVGPDDYLLMDISYGKITGQLSESLLAQREAQFGSAYVAALTAAVPEPTSLGIIGLGAVGLLGRRRRAVR